MNISDSDIALLIKSFEDAGAQVEKTGVSGGIVINGSISTGKTVLEGFFGINNKEYSATILVDGKETKKQSIFDTNEMLSLAA